MRKLQISSGFYMAVMVLASGGAASASSYERLNTGLGGPDSYELAVDQSGNLYETAASQGSAHAGEVFQWSVASGYSTGTALYTVGSGGSAEGDSLFGSVTLSGGSIVGTAATAGVHGDGTVFTLGPPCQISMTVLHAFAGSTAKPTDGYLPTGWLVSGPYSLLYAITQNGGKYDKGTAYAVSTSVTSPAYQLIHSFGAPGDSSYPNQGALTIDSMNRLFGTSQEGGANNKGAVFMLQHINGGWQEQVIYSFPASGGYTVPTANLVVDQQGNLYGCANGGANGKGDIFRLAPPDTGSTTWQLTTLYDFGTAKTAPEDEPYDGSCGLARDATTGVIYGTTAAGGADNAGTIFALAPPGNGKAKWVLSIIHSFFGGRTLDGGQPLAPPLQVGAAFYGTNHNNGAIYKIIP